MTVTMIHLFGEGKAEGLGLGKEVLGGKAANLTEMASMGIPVPPGIVISTEACRHYNKNSQFPLGLKEQLSKKFAELEALLGRRLGSRQKPLLVSVRSGSPVSMPGMMDTILNLGLNEESLAGLMEDTQNERFALDSYRRFLQMFSDVVLGIPHKAFEEILHSHKKKAEVKQDFELSPAQLRSIIADYKALVQQERRLPFPEDVQEQLQSAIEAVFRSWNNERALYYRRMNHIPDSLGTAVTIQSMVFGNMGQDCGTGVAFTRNPSTGEKQFYGEYLLNAQGEDVVAGIRTPHPITKLEEDMPEMYQELFEIQKRLEAHFGDMQDIEFTIQKKKLFLLQTRNGKRTAVAALKIAVDMVEEGQIDKKAALRQIHPEALPSLLAPIFLEGPKQEAIRQGRLLAKGLNAGPGAASGLIALDSITANTWAKEGRDVILVRQETSPEDIMGMEHAKGILTARGGMTSHAAVVARGMNKPCVVGCTALEIDYGRHCMRLSNERGEMIQLKEGDEISIDGGTGEVISGLLARQSSEIDQCLKGAQSKSALTENFLKLMGWADEVRQLKIRANADSPRDALTARSYGAQGIGLCRTEHMFFEGTRLPIMREMILADTLEERQKALDALLVFQKRDFTEMFEAMDGLPLTVRLLDPPLHEFLPHSSEQNEELAKRLNVSPEAIAKRSAMLKEENPMLGHRGCRLGISFPEITRMQVRALISAAIAVQKKGVKVYPEIMVPLVGHAREFDLQKEVIDQTAREIMAKERNRVDYLVGSMIEVPRAAVMAHEIAQHAQFFSFGTNDLTQMTLAFSRDDSNTFLPAYMEFGIYEVSPFQSLDVKGVGELLKIAVARGKQSRPQIKLGVCGEHGGDPASIVFFHQLGLEYVSCSPFRVPVARLAAAQAALQEI